MRIKHSTQFRVVPLAMVVAVIYLGSIQYSKAADSGEQIFQSRCTACHTIGKGKLVGPDLAGVTSRREESWLIRQIKEPDSLVAENDPVAMQLLQEANGVPMVSLGLSDAEVAAVIAYLKAIEQQAEVATGLPSEYLPTVIVSIALLIGLTSVGLIVGRKKVDVR
ncbi:MAG: cytochrome c [Nitrospinaceae bacterium]|nr:cytochrome c [Nitrospinaceae bacterium]